MARIEYLQINDEEKRDFEKGLVQGDRFLFSKICGKKSIVSRKKKTELKNKSLFSTLGNMWKSLDSSDVIAWNNAGAFCNKTGFNLFVQDQTYRLKNNLPGFATPSNLHQSFVGKIILENTIKDVSILQKHSHFYNIISPVIGKKTMVSAVKIVEDFALPLKIGLSYKSNFVASGENPFSIFRANVWSAFQGENIYTYLEIPLTLVCDWQAAEATLSTVPGTLVKYDLCFYFNDLQGSLFFDNIIAEHSGQNWAFDPFCENINNEPEKNINNTVKNWEIDGVNNNVSFFSEYYN